MSPPWGTLNAIDLNTGDLRWRIPLGEVPALSATGLKNTGSDNYGGPVVTASGLLFIGATNIDTKFRSAPSTRAPARCCGRPRCRRPAMPRRRSTCATAGSTS